MPPELVNGFRIMASGMVVDVGDGPLPFGKIMAAAGAAAVVVIIANNWEKVSPMFPSIIAAFKQAFSESASQIVSAFNTLKAEAKEEAEKKEKEKPTGKTVGDVHKRLKKEGFKKTGQSGSHETWEKGGRHVTVPYHGSEKEEIPTGTLRNIWRQAGWIQ